MTEFLGTDIIEWYAIPIDRWSVEEYISILQELGFEDETSTEKVTSDNIFGTIRWSWILERVITIRILIRTMSIEFCRELCIFVALDDDTIVEELCILIWLGYLDSFQKWLFIESEVIESSTFCRERKWKNEKYEKYDVFFHMYYRIFLSFLVLRAYWNRE
jgi:hypothetical protein